MLEGLLQPRHLLLILIIALVVFGPKRVPESKADQRPFAPDLLEVPQQTLTDPTAI
jgi:hypothetical protein